MTELYVLCEDTDMTLRSQPWPTGKAVRTRAEAEAWVESTENRGGYFGGKFDRMYVRVEVVTLEELKR
jgi:hypothetical protein